MSERSGYCPHFREVMDLNDCFFCFFKKIVGSVKEETDSVELLRQSRDRYQKAVESQEEGSVKEAPK